MKPKSKKTSALPDVGTIGIEELIPPIEHTENPETLRQHNKSLESANFTLNEFNNSLMKKLQEKDAEISHLKNLLLGGNLPIFGNEGLVAATPEEQLIQVQIKKIQESSMLRELSLDEVKRFDLLMKNKNLIQERPTEINGRQKTAAKPKTKEELVGLAAKKTSEENQ